MGNRGEDSGREQGVDRKGTGSPKALLMRKVVVDFLLAGIF